MHVERFAFIRSGLILAAAVVLLPPVAAQEHMHQHNMANAPSAGAPPYTGSAMSGRDRQMAA